MSNLWTARPRFFSRPTISLFIFGNIFFLWILASCNESQKGEVLPEQYRQSGAFIKTLPYFNPDSCVLLVKENVPPKWQGAAYENLILDGPEDSPLELGFQHLDYYERYFPADSARAFSQLWRGRLGHPDSAAAKLQESYDISMRLKNYLKAGDAKEAMGVISYNQGKTAEALRSFLEVYDAVKNLDNSQNERKVIALSNITNTYHQSGNFEEARIWASKMWPLVKDESVESMRQNKVKYYMKLGLIHLKLNLPDTAINMLQEALRLQEKYQTLNSRAEIINHLGFAYLEKKDCQNAFPLLKVALEQGSENPYLLGEINLNLANCHLCLGQLDSAELYNKKCLETTDPFVYAKANEQISEVYGKKGNYQAAFEAMNAAVEIRQKIYSIEKVQEVGAAKVALELENTRLQANNAQEIQKGKIQKMWLMLLGTLLVAGFFIGLFFRSRGISAMLKNQQQLAEAREVLQLQELENAHKKLEQTTHKLQETSQLLELKTQLFEEWERKAILSNELDKSTLSTLSNGELQILTKNDWQNYQLKFESVFPGVIAKLRTEFPTITNSEARLFMLIKTGLNNNEIANVLGISIESVWKTRYRVKKKLDIVGMEDFDDFVMNY